MRWSERFWFVLFLMEKSWSFLKNGRVRNLSTCERSNQKYQVPKNVGWVGAKAQVGVAWSGGGRPLSGNRKDGIGADTGIFLILRIQTHYCCLS